jgi:hypothetical protein
MIESHMGQVGDLLAEYDNVPYGTGMRLTCRV